MKKMALSLLKTILPIFIICVFALNQSNAQSDKVFKKWGTTAGLFVYSENQGSLDLGFFYGIRYNLKNLSDNFSVAVDASPNLIGHISEYSGLGLKIPVELTLNIGAGSTYDSDKTYGVALGAGLAASFHPLIAFKTDYRDVDKFGLYPTVSLGFRRFKSDSSALSEFSLRYFFIPSKELQEIPSFGLQVSWSKFIGY